MGNKTISILFDVQQLYYLPQYLPVYHELLKQDAGDATFVFYHSIHDAVSYTHLTLPTILRV